MPVLTLNQVLPLVNNGRGSVSFLLSAATVTSSITTPDIPGIDFFTLATLFWNVTAGSGTSPTIDCYVQKKLVDPTFATAGTGTYQDIAHFAQITSTGKRVMSLVNGGNLEEAQQTNALAASTVNSVHFGSVWRISFVVAGTTPSFTFDFGMDMGS